MVKYAIRDKRTLKVINKVLSEDVSKIEQGMLPYSSTTEGKRIFNIYTDSDGKLIVVSSD